jgi:hypothetical protein
VLIAAAGERASLSFLEIFAANSGDRWTSKRLH